MNLIRSVLGKLILFFDGLFKPKVEIVRDVEKQGEVDEEISSSLVLYEFESCPFCVKVRRALKRLGLRIPSRDAQNDAQAKQELLSGGGELQVPCLRIQEKDGSIKWMYESDDIIQYLGARFGGSSVSPVK